VTLPALAFGLLLASALAAAYHLVLGRSLRQLAWFWAASVAGFVAGQFLGSLLPWPVPALGLLHPIEGGILSLAAMSVVRSFRL